MTMVDRETAARMSGELVNRQNFYTIVGGGTVGAIKGIWSVSKGEDSNEVITDIISGLGGGILAQSLVFFIASREPAKNVFWKYFQDKCCWLLKTPLPAIFGATSFIGLKFILTYKN